MKTFISEYGTTIVECVGVLIIVAIVYQYIFKTSAFLTFINGFLISLMGG